MKYYYTNQWFQVVTGLLTVFTSIITINPSLYKDLQSKGLVLAILIVAIVTTFFANVQSGTRFFSTNPIFYLNAGSFLLRRKGQRWTVMQFLVLIYFLTYNLAGVMWFPKRFNWS